MMDAVLDLSRWFLMAVTGAGVVIYASKGRVVALLHAIAFFAILGFKVWGLTGVWTPVLGIMANVGTGGAILWAMVKRPI